MANIHPIAKPLAVLSFVIVALITTADAGPGKAKVTRGSFSDCATASAIIGCGGPSWRTDGIKFK